MREVVYHDDQRFIEWAAQRTGVASFRSDAKAIGLVKGDEILAAVIYDDFSDTDCNMHVASNGSRLWLTREYLVRCFTFPFIQCGFRRVTGLVPSKNEAALKFDLHLGFRLEGRCRDAAPDGDDVLVLGMLRRECRFIPEEYRQ